MNTVARSSPAAAAPAIGTAFLLPHDRIARAPLRTWAAELHERLRRCREQSRTAALVSEQVGGIANNAALIAAHRGAGGVARRLCERQMWWQAKLSRRSRDATLADGCVQPWINLARLESLSGEWESAIARLNLLRLRRANGALALQPLRSDGVGCQQVRATGGLGESLETVYVIDSLRVLLQNGQFERVIEFAGRIPANVRARLELWTDEATVVAACRLGDVAGAEQAARNALGRRETVGWARAVFRLRLAEVLSCAGKAESASAILENLATVMGGLSEPVLRNLQTLYVLMPLAGACRAAGLQPQAESLACAVYQGAKAANDEAFQVDALRLLVALDSSAERERWRGVLDALETSTDYKRYRLSGINSTGAGEFDTLDAELIEVFGT